MKWWIMRGLLFSCINFFKFLIMDYDFRDYIDVQEVKG